MHPAFHHPGAVLQVDRQLLPRHRRRRLGSAAHRRSARSARCRWYRRPRAPRPRRQGWRSSPRPWRSAGRCRLPSAPYSTRTSAAESRISPWVTSTLPLKIAVPSALFTASWSRRHLDRQGGVLRQGRQRRSCASCAAGARQQGQSPDRQNRMNECTCSFLQILGSSRPVGIPAGRRSLKTRT